MIHPLTIAGYECGLSVGICRTAFGLRTKLFATQWDNFPHLQCSGVVPSSLQETGDYWKVTGFRLRHTLSLVLNPQAIPPRAGFCF